MKRITKEQLNHHTKRVLESMNQVDIIDYTLQLDESNGHIWIIVSNKVLTLLLCSSLGIA